MPRCLPPTRRAPCHTADSHQNSLQCYCKVPHLLTSRMPLRFSLLKKWAASQIDLLYNDVIWPCQVLPCNMCDSEMAYEAGFRCTHTHMHLSTRGN